MGTKSFKEVVKNCREKLIEEIVKAKRSVYENAGRIEYTIYIWEDTEEIVIEEEAQGSQSYLVPNNKDRILYNVCTIDSPLFDWENFADYSELYPTENEEGESVKLEGDEYEALRKATIDFLMEDAESEASDILDEAIKYNGEWDDYHSEE